MKIKNILSNSDKKQIISYLFVGVWNTFFGYGVYVCLVWLFTDELPFAYMFANILSSIVSVTQSFFLYKFFVFKTKGNYIKEYLKCWTVYGSAFLVNLALLPIFVWMLNMSLSKQYLYYSPYLAGLVLLFITIVISFFGHKNITFKRKDRV